MSSIPNNVNKLILEFNAIFRETGIEYIPTLPNTQLFWNGWTFHSINKILENRKLYQERFYDIGTTFGDMGFIFILGYIPTTQLFFVRPAGGSELSDRLTFYKKYIKNNYLPNKFNLYDTNCVINVQISCDKLRSVLAYDFMGNTHNLLCLDGTMLS